MIRATGSITCLYETRDVGGALLRLACETTVDGHARHYPVTKKAVEVVLGFPHGCDQDTAVCGPRGVIELSLRPRVVHNCHRCVVLVHRYTGPEVRNQVCHFRSLLSSGSPQPAREQSESAQAHLGVEGLVVPEEELLVHRALAVPDPDGDHVDGECLAGGRDGAALAIGHRLAE